MRGYRIIAAFTVLLVSGFAQDVLMESDSDDSQLLRIENTGSHWKNGIYVNTTATGLTVYSPYQGMYMDIYNSAGDAYGMSGYTTGANNSWTQLYGGATYGGSYSSNYGVNVYAYGGSNSYNYGVHGYAGGGTFNAAGYFDGKLYYGTMHAISDQKFKTNIRDYHDGLGKIMALRPRLYEMRVGEFQGKVNLSSGTHIGLVAQELETVLPELVSTAYAPAHLTKEEQKARVKKEHTEYKALDYTGIIPVLVKAMQEQQALIEALQAEVAALKK